MIVTRPQPPPSKKQTRLFVGEENKDVDARASGSSAKRSKIDEVDASNTTATSASKRHKSSKIVEAASAGPSTVKAKSQRKVRSLAN